jgi:protein-tyrosine phosphatase
MVRKLTKLRKSQDCECSLVQHVAKTPAADLQWNSISEQYEWMCDSCVEEFLWLDGSSLTPDSYLSRSKGGKEDAPGAIVEAADRDAQLPLNSGAVVPAARAPLYMPRTCKHHLTPFSWEAKGETYQVYLSASSDTASPEQGPLPTSCLYLSDAWIRTDSILANFGKWRNEDEPYIVYCEWQDFKTIGMDTVRRLTKYTVDALEKGHRLEIGCAGGHGRTGTMTGLLMVATGVRAEDAIKDIRSRYCGKAVETKAQADLIRAFEKEG